MSYPNFENANHLIYYILSLLNSTSFLGFQIDHTIPVQIVAATFEKLPLPSDPVNCRDLTIRSVCIITLIFSQLVIAFQTAHKNLHMKKRCSMFSSESKQGGHLVDVLDSYKSSFIL